MAYVNTSTYTPHMGRGRIAASRRDRVAASYLQTFGIADTGDSDSSDAEDVPTTLARKLATFRSDTLPSAKATKYFYGANDAPPRGSYAQFKASMQGGRTLSEAKDQVAPDRGSIRRVDPKKVSASFKPGDFSADRTSQREMSERRRREEDSDIGRRVAEKFGSTAAHRMEAIRRAQPGLTREQRRTLLAAEPESVYNTKRLHLRQPGQRRREAFITRALKARAAGPKENFIKSARAKLRATERKVQKSIAKAEARRGASSARAAPRGGVGMGGRRDRAERDRRQAARRVTGRGAGAVRAEVVEEAARHTARWGMMEEDEVSGLRDRLAASGVLGREDADRARHMPESAHTGVFSLREAAGRYDQRGGGASGGGLRGGGGTKVLTLMDLEAQRARARAAKRELAERQLTSGRPVVGGGGLRGARGRIIRPRDGGLAVGDVALDPTRAQVASEVQEKRRWMHRHQEMRTRLFDAEKGKAGKGTTRSGPGPSFGGLRLRS